MKLNPETRNSLMLISMLLNKAEEEFSKLSRLNPEDSDAIFNHHSPSTSLDHCLRWGPQASIDLLIASADIDKNKSNSTFFRKVFLVDSASESDISSQSLEQMTTDFMYDSRGGYVHDLGHAKITGQEAAKLLLGMGTETSFFRLEEDGSDAKEKE